MTSNIAEIHFERKYDFSEVSRELSDGVKVIAPRAAVNTLFLSKSIIYSQRFTYNTSAVREFAMRTIQEVVENSSLWRILNVGADITEAVIKTDETMTVQGLFGRKRNLPLETKIVPEKILVAGVIQYEPEVAEHDAQKHLRALQSKGYQCKTKTFEQLKDEKISRLERRVRSLEADKPSIDDEAVSGVWGWP